MIVETSYSPWDLKRGKCEDCGDISNEILIEENVCVDCVESEKFYQMTMKGL